jgi:hypothetical protein
MLPQGSGPDRSRTNPFWKGILQNRSLAIAIREYGRVASRSAPALHCGPTLKTEPCPIRLRDAQAFDNDVRSTSIADYESAADVGRTGLQWAVMKGDERKLGELVAPILIGGQAPAGEADTKLQDILEFDHDLVRAAPAQG